MVEKQSKKIKGAGRGGSREGAGRKPGIQNKATLELKEAALAYTQEALNTLAKICKSGKSESARVAAACAILDRAHGKPKQQAEITGKDGKDLIPDKPIDDLELARRCAYHFEMARQARKAALTAEENG
jgi:hypothetical protein